MNRLEKLRKAARGIQIFSLVLVVAVAAFQLLLPTVFQSNPMIGTVAYYAITICIALLIGVNGLMIFAIHSHKKNGK